MRNVFLESSRERTGKHHLSQGVVPAGDSGMITFVGMEADLDTRLGS